MPANESEPKLFVPNEHLGDDMNKNLVDSEMVGGSWLEKLPVGKNLSIETQNHTYTLEKRDDGLYLSGNPKLCPKPRKVSVSGSTWGGSAIKAGFVGRGMYLEFRFADDENKISPYHTSEIKEVTEL